MAQRMLRPGLPRHWPVPVQPACGHTGATRHAAALLCCRRQCVHRPRERALDAPTKAHSEQLSTITTEAAKMAERDSTVDMFDGSFVLAPTDSMFPIDSAMWEFNERLLDEPSPSGESIASSLEDNLIDALTALQAERARNDRLQLQIEVARSLAPGGCPSDRVLAAVLSLQSAARASSFSQSSRLRSAFPIRDNS